MIVGATVYPIDYAKQVRDAGNKPMYGLTVYATPAITLSEEYGETPQKETLFHEISHCVDEWMNLQLKESQIRQLSLGLYEVLSRNPKVLRWMMDK